jgi:hypothetical protein
MNIKKTALTLSVSALMSGSVFAACSADIDMGNQKITNLATPTAYADAVTKKYADDAIELASYGYGTIQYNNLTWLDRNLGATRIPSSATDTSAGTTGYLIQWGRDLDGHQFRKLSNGTNGSDEDASVDYKTNTLATSAQPGHSKFITINADPENWLATPDANLWQGTNGVNNPCPAGYRLPTKDDFNVDNFNNSADIYAALKLNYAGRRYNLNGSIAFVGEKAFYWSSTVDGEKTYVLYFRSNDEFFTYSTLRANGLSVRCVK